MKRRHGRRKQDDSARRHSQANSFVTKARTLHGSILAPLSGTLIAVFAQRGTVLHQHHAIHRVPGVRGGNVYLLTGAGPVTLVDAGLPGSAPAVLRFMEALGLHPRDLQRILITHRHADHFGGAMALREETGARVHAHRGDVRVIDGQALMESRLGTATLVDVVLEGGEELEGGITAVHTGGHTQGATCYHLPAARALFLGDMAINNVDRLSRPITFSNEDNDAYEAGLARLTEIDADAGYFGHGPVLATGLQEALRALKARSRSPLWRAALSFVWLRLRRRRAD